VKYLSVCSGIEAATVAWHHMGWKPVGFSEIEKFPSKVLAHHYPDVPNLGDMTKFKEWPDESIDILVGGTPCQSFSVAGLRKGLDDPRGNLMLTYLAIAARYRPKWLVWENVPGVLSSNGGEDFACLLRGLAELGYGWAYRILDAQYFGVAQRRRRVFVVGCLGDWHPAAAVLFERDSLSGNPAPRREKRQDVAKCITRGISQRYDSETETMITTHAFTTGSIGTYRDGIGTLRANGGDIGGGSENLITQPVAQPMAFRETADCLTAAYGTKWNGNASADNGSLFAAQPVAVDIDNCNLTGDCAGNILAGAQMRTNKGMGVMTAMQVRRLTPTECERLQGFPDGYTNIKENCPDGPRYKALGNSMAVPVMRWIGERIQTVNEFSDINKSKRAA
jgi:DNA (cytosine-5)-methyltransferase 1